VQARTGSLRPQHLFEGADDLQAVGVTLRRPQRFWIRAADLVQRPQPLAPVSSSPAQPLFA